MNFSPDVLSINNATRLYIPYLIYGHDKVLPYLKITKKILKKPRAITKKNIVPETDVLKLI